MQYEINYFVAWAVQKGGFFTFILPLIEFFKIYSFTFVCIFHIFTLLGVHAVELLSLFLKVA